MGEVAVCPDCEMGTFTMGKLARFLLEGLIDGGPLLNMLPQPDDELLKKLFNTGELPLPEPLVDDKGLEVRLECALLLLLF